MSAWKWAAMTSAAVPAQLTKATIQLHPLLKRASASSLCGAFSGGSQDAGGVDACMIRFQSRKRFRTCNEAAHCLAHKPVCKSKAATEPRSSMQNTEPGPVSMQTNIPAVRISPPAARTVLEGKRASSPLHWPHLAWSRNRAIRVERRAVALPSLPALRGTTAGFLARSVPHPEQCGLSSSFCLPQ